MCKKLIYLTSFVLVLGLALPSVVEAADPDLVGWWKLDDASGTIAIDSSGNGHDGTLLGDPQWVAGMLGGALHFDGDGDAVHIGNADVFNFPGSFSISVWVNYEAWNGGWSNVMVGKEGEGGRSWQLRRHNGNDNLTFTIRGTTGDDDPQGTIVPTFGEWHHVVAIYDADAETRTVYIDNVLDVQIDDSGVHSPDDNSLYIGARSENNDAGPTGFLQGMIDDVYIFSRALTVDEIPLISKGLSPGSASEPIPDDEAIEVLRNVDLSWTPGEFANTHDVYLGTIFDDVNDADRGDSLDVLVSQGQNATTYEPDSRLDFGQTYYWRIDEVNAPPDSTIFKGYVWSFTTELFVYPIENVTAAASSSSEGQGPENTVNGFGLDVNDLDLHSTDLASMWLTATGDPGPARIQYEFDKVYKLHEMLVWNHNGPMEPVIGFGCKDVSIEYSVNGTDYTALGAAHEFARGTGAAEYAPNTTVDFEGVAAKYVRLMPTSNWGGLMPQYGLSEVRFLYIPAQATEPSPESGATDAAIDVTLGFRAGREAAEHDVYLSTDEQAVIDGTAPVNTVTEASYSTSLDLGSNYYWRVDEVNDAETPTTWQGEIWNFSTQEYLVVDDFELYNDLNTDDPESNRIFLTWIDGFDNPAVNGAIVGYADAPFAERSIVSGGKQSMPFSYDNSTAGNSEATSNIAELQVGWDWTKGAPETLVLLIHGNLSNAAADQLYVKINDTKVMYGGDLSEPIWKQWNVDLASLGIDLSNITTLSIGVDGGGSGMLYVDDIALYRIAPPVVEPAPGSDMSLVGHWKLDETSGLTAADSSGYGNDGTLMNMTGTEWTAGIKDGALMLNGSGQYVDFGNPKSLQLTEEVTISAWAKMEPANEDAYMGIAGKMGDTTGANRGFVLVRHSSNVFRFWVVADGDFQGGASSDVTYNDTDWHHLVGVVSNNTGSLYVDGVKQASEVEAELQDSGDIANIGRQYDDSSDDRLWNGTIDDVRIYYRALSEQEILGL